MRATRISREITRHLGHREPRIPNEAADPPPALTKLTNVAWTLVHATETTAFSGQSAMRSTSLTEARGFVSVNGK